MIKAVLFDLDGTLLHMKQEEFAKGYFGLLAKKLIPYGFEPEELTATVWEGTAAMVKNSGVKTNIEIFWEVFASKYGKEALKNREIFDSFYLNEFEAAKEFCALKPESAEIIKEIKQMGFRLILVSNPIFPLSAMKARLRWAGVNPDDFEYITSYENSSFSKPNPKLYTAVANHLKLAPESCIMVGNDVKEDLVAEKAGMQVYLITDSVINKENKDLNSYNRGSLYDLVNFLKKSQS